MVQSHVQEQSGASLRGNFPVVENTGSANLQNDVPLETSIPAASLESILCTEELLNRASRPPDQGGEFRTGGTHQRASRLAANHPANAGR